MPRGARRLRPRIGEWYSRCADPSCADVNGCAFCLPGDEERVEDAAEDTEDAWVPGADNDEEEAEDAMVPGVGAEDSWVPGDDEEEAIIMEEKMRFTYLVSKRRRKVTRTRLKMARMWTSWKSSTRSKVEQNLADRSNHMCVNACSSSQKEAQVAFV